MSIQSSINGAMGSIAGAIVAAKKFGKSKETEPKADSGIDAKMAAKARRTAQQKINAIYANNSLSQKARTRRMGKVMDEYNRILGGK